MNEQEQLKEQAQFFTQSNYLNLYIEKEQKELISIKNLLNKAKIPYTKTPPK